MAFEVFVSYSRHDEPIVVPVVKLLRLGDHGMVFLDLDSIPPGELWRGRLEEALSGARYIVLFWCEHACNSREVEREYRAALATGKTLVPVLLDRTPLPPGLAEHQWIDLSALATATHRPHLPPPPPPPSSPPPVPPTVVPGAPARPPSPAAIPDDWDPFAVEPARPSQPADFAGTLGLPEAPAADLDALFGLPGPQARPAAAAAAPSPSLDAMAVQIRDELLRRARQDGVG